MKTFLLLALSLFSSTAAYSDPQTEEETLKQICPRHLEMAKKDPPFASRCEQTRLASDLSELHKSALETCKAASVHISASKTRLEDLKATEAKALEEARQLEAAVASNDVNIDMLKGAQAAASSANQQLIDNFRKRAQDTKFVLEELLAAYKDVREKELKYDNALSGLHMAGNRRDEGGYCPGDETDWFRVQTDGLSGELVDLRKSLGKNVQAMNALYQKSLTALGASQEQAVSMANGLIGGDGVSIREDGSIDGVKGSFLDHFTGGPSPHDTTIGRVECPAGTIGSTCYGSVPAAADSHIGNDELAAITGDSVGLLDPSPASGTGTVDDNGRADLVTSAIDTAETAAPDSAIPRAPELHSATWWNDYDATESMRATEAGYRVPARISDSDWLNLSQNPDLSPSLAKASTPTDVQRYQMAVNDALREAGGTAYTGPLVYVDGQLGPRTQAATSYLMDGGDRQKAFLKALGRWGL